MKIKVQNPDNNKIDTNRLKLFIANERAQFIAKRPIGSAQNIAIKDKAQTQGFLGGVPQHWMLDWPTPFPIYIKSAKGTNITDIDDNVLVDLCLGDTGAMFGHAPDVIKEALEKVGQNGLTAMLPSHLSAQVGAKLSQIFNLPYWQIALSASDANRFALRLARLVSGKQKILVFDGCYHGAVDETAVCLDKNGKTIAKPSLWGSAFDPAINTYCVPFNDEALLEAALYGDDIACIIMEPALTNCGIIAPNEGFLEYVFEIAKKHNALILMDETHTLSTGIGGYCKNHGLKPDLFVTGKAVAGGVPCAVWGFSQAIKDNLIRIRHDLPKGHSGIGTTLGGSLLQLMALDASLEYLMTKDIYDKMINNAKAFEHEILKIIAKFGLDWSVVKLAQGLK